MNRSPDSVKPEGFSAEFERNIIRKRVLSGLETAKAKGIRLGRSRRSQKRTSLRRVVSRLRDCLPEKSQKLLHVSKMAAWRAMNS
ncbi:transposon Tn2501 resolvase [Gluconobacter thailandicus NBRC 3257]|uniref:Transposon Tn2501 resolvase n=1 Tax=Gluconobacter thailandicus NBRC 3257 TaxID=1381097 RepID=A0ABQ0IWA8_GLUTH|nr:hypothetical protein [Gluconobacter thailandicus]GAC89546.1 transposon Tn2501 resolvase [Gluconobacter thailandicus NBRC 3255]GAD26496.1 transposon Tn2501 resolvase [Gluconobacter thailandicus NBRC 3257]